MKHDEDDIVPSDIRILDSLESRAERGKKTLSFGVNFLDKALDGIIESDIVLIGARTGTGKSDLAIHIARTNIRQKKKVHLFALEAYTMEVEDRIWFQEAAKLFYNDPRKPLDCEVTFPNFITNKIGKSFEKYERDSLEKFRKELENLFVTYRGFKDYSIDRFIQKFHKIKGGADLVIIDHLNYFDLATDRENVEYTKIVKTIRDLTLETRVPIILIAHLRKTNKSLRNLMPEIDDFHGTSNISKIANKAILMDAKFNGEAIDNIWETYMRAAKYRADGGRTRFVAVTKYDSKTREYLPEFTLGKIIFENGKESFSELGPNEFPRWAKEKPKNVYYPPRETKDFYEPANSIDF